MSEYIQYEAAIYFEGKDGTLTNEAGPYESMDSFETSPLYFEAVRVALGDREGRMSDEQVQAILREAAVQLSPEEMEFLKKAFRKIGSGIKKFGKAAVRVGKKALPVVGRLAQIAAPIAGTIIGGPVGAQIGGLVSSGIGSLLNRGGGQAIPRSPSPVAMSNPSLSGNIRLLQPQQPAANQLLGLLQNPAFLQSLVGQVLGGRSQGTVRMRTPSQGGNSNIPFGAFMNLLGQLSTQAAVEANGHIKSKPTYLYDAQGEFLIDDPASNEARAKLLLDMLSEHTLANYQFPKIERSDPMAEWFRASGLINK